MFGRVEILLGLVCTLLFREARATIVLFGNETISFASMDASFTPSIPESGILGSVYAAEPSNACSALAINDPTKIAFAVVERGDCTFEQKVRNSQDAGYAAVIVFDKVGGNLVTMSGNAAGITIYAVYVTKEAGEKLWSLEGSVYLLPGIKRETWAVKWLVLSVSLIGVVLVSAIVTTLCCIRQHILAEAEKEAYNEKLLHDDDYILNREFIPDDLGPEALGFQDVMTDTEGENSDVFHSEGPSDSDHASDISVHDTPK